MVWATTLARLCRAERRRMRGAARGIGLALLLAGLSACVDAPSTAVLKPQARPERAAPAPIVPVQLQATSEKSAALRASFTEIQSAQLTLGLLRRDGGGPDTPYTSTMLARNFIEIAFFNEYGGAGLAEGAAGRLRRWDSPVTLGIEFGASVPPSQRVRDEQDVARFASRLARVTGHPVGLGATPNFMVLFASEDDRAASLARVAQRLPGIDTRDLARLQNLPDDIYCVVLAFPAADNPFAYGAAVALVRAENPDLLRLSCIHEELAQGMGLANDSPEARPSIFNDDDEFALLTSHDELLLDMLYDARLQPGMSMTDAAPIVRALAQARVDGGGV